MKRQANNYAHYRDCLTNEMLTKHFKSQFDLVRYAIEEAAARIRGGHDGHNPMEENVVTDVLEDIAEGRIGMRHSDEEGDESCDDECEVELEEIEEEKPKSKKRVKV